MSESAQTSRPLYILFVEDALTDVELAERVLVQEGLQFTPLRVETRADFVAALDQFRPDVIISDYRLPRFDGLSALKLALAWDASCPFIILTGSLNEEIAVACIKAGATDYVIKDHLLRLPFAVREALDRRQARVAQLSAEQALRESEAKLRSYIEHAPLGIFVADGQGRYLEVNPAGLDLLEYDAATLFSKHLTEIVPEEGHTVIFHAAHCLRTTGSFVGELRQRTRSGRILWISLHGVRVTDNRFMAFCQDITEQKYVESQLKYLNTHDPLTGLYNRAFFETELARLEGGREFPVSLIIGDVDNLKATNDTHGHTAGDDLLRRAAQALQSVFRSSDILARIGGDEFALILPATDAATVADILERIRGNLIQLNAEPAAMPLSLSLGAATSECTPLVEAFKAADAQMYQEKRAHKFKLDPEPVPLAWETHREPS